MPPRLRHVVCEGESVRNLKNRGSTTLSNLDFRYGASAVAAVLGRQAPSFAPLGRPVIVNGGPGSVVGPPGRIVAVAGLTISGGPVREINIIGDPAKLHGIEFDELNQS